MLITLSNKNTFLTINPSIARVIQYQTNHHDWFFTNPSESDKTYTTQDCLSWKTWPNPGGARTDVAPQSAWAKTTWGKDWPPPPVLSAQRKVTYQDETSMIFETPSDDMLQIHLETKIELVPNSTRVEITTKLTNTANEPKEWANWLIIQLAAVPNQSQILVPKAAGQQIIPLMGKGVSINHRHHDLEIAYSGTEFKLGFSSTRSIDFQKQKKDNEFFCLETNFDSNDRCPDNSPIQLYTSGNPRHPYVELEAVGELKKIESGESITDYFRWAIRPL